MPPALSGRVVNVNNVLLKIPGQARNDGKGQVRNDDVLFKIPDQVGNDG